MKQATSKFLAISSAALLAGTVFAAAQGASDRKDNEGGAGAQRPGLSQSQPKAGQSQPKAGQAEQGQRREQGAQSQPSRPSTSGQAPGAQGQKESPRDQEQRRTQGQSEQDRTRTQGQNENQRDQNRAQQGQNQRGQEPNRTEGRGEQAGKASGGTNSVTLSTEQRTKLRQTVIEGRNAPKVGRVDFSVSEGTVIPRTVHVVAVPETLVEIHPEWRGYRYFVYNDEIIIVEPSTLRIVAIVAV